MDQCGSADSVLNPDHRGRSFLLLNADDPHYQDNHYAESLKGSGWESNVILGVAGAEKQVRFADRICPRGSHVVIIDDNITELYKGVTAATGRIELRPAEEGDLSKLIMRANAAMASSDCNVYAVVSIFAMRLFMHMYFCQCGTVVNTLLLRCGG